MISPWEMYDAKLLKKLEEDAKFISFFENSPKVITPEQIRRYDIISRWQQRGTDRVKKYMEAYHVSASSLCDCDY